MQGHSCGIGDVPVVACRDRSRHRRRLLLLRVAGKPWLEVARTRLREDDDQRRDGGSPTPHPTAGASILAVNDSYCELNNLPYVIRKKVYPKTVSSSPLIPALPMIKGQNGRAILGQPRAMVG